MKRKYDSDQWVKEVTKGHFRKQKKVNRFRFLFFGIIIFYLSIKFIPMIMSSTKDADTVEYGNIQIIDKLNCYVIRNEKILKSNTEGNIKYFVQDGEKVEKGYKIAEIYRQTVDDATRKKLEVINQRIESLNANKDDLFQSDVKKLDAQIDEIINNIILYNKKGNLLKVYQLKKDLKNKLDKRNIIIGDKSFAGKNLEILNQEQQQLEEKINNAISSITTPDSGIISYHIDGYETILNPRNMTTIELEKLQNIHSQVTDLHAEKVIGNQPLFKIVDNDFWYMITWVDDDKIENYDVGKTVTFKFVQRDIQGSIYKIVENEKDNMVIFQLDEYVDDFFALRNIDLDVIVVNYEGLKIHKDSIIEKDGQKGVYVLDVNRYTRFKPIKIIGYDDEWAIIKNNIFYEKDGDSIKTVYTVKLYDEIVRNALKIKEGQMIY